MSEEIKAEFKMVEIYGGKDDDWKGYHNFILNLGDAGNSKPLAGPLDPETSQQILEAMGSNIDKAMSEKIDSLERDKVALISLLENHGVYVESISDSCIKSSVVPK